MQLLPFLLVDICVDLLCNASLLNKLCSWAERYIALSAPEQDNNGWNGGSVCKRYLLPTATFFFMSLILLLALNGEEATPRLVLCEEEVDDGHTLIKHYP